MLVSLAYLRTLATYDQSAAGSTAYGGGGGGSYSVIEEPDCPAGIDENNALLLTGIALAVGASLIYFEIASRIPGKKKRKRRRRRDAPVVSWLDKSKSELEFELNCDWRYFGV